MASLSSSTSSATLPLKKYDVFISFRGDDTRSGFTSHLHKALSRIYVNTYIDYRIQKGNQIWDELVNAINDSTLFLVVFSLNYADSTWCLNELVEIMNCYNQNDEQVVVVPVFYQIEPTHIRKQSGTYHTAFAKHKNKGNGDDRKMQNWKNALFQASNLSGFHSDTYKTDAELIEEITRVVVEKLNHKETNELTCNFIQDENYWSIESLIKNDSSEVQIIGLWGMGGIGKTTLAYALFQKVSFQYEGICFLENVTEELNKHDINHIFNILLKELLKDDFHIVTPKVISSSIMRRLKRMKAFIVLDDVRDAELLQKLIGVGHGWLGAGSTVIVTTRDFHVLMSGRIDKIHQVQKMNSKNSFQLFNLHAFDNVLPKEKYVELSKRAIDYAKGNPLTLKVLGSFLRGKSEVEWKCALAKLKGSPRREIDRILRSSYNELDDKEKNIFLDIACFLKGFQRDYITKILNECGFFADIGIRRLLELALIRVDSENCIQMHDLIQEMGKQIVREESLKNPGERSRLWDLKEVCDVLKNNRGTEKIEAILLNAVEDTHINLSPKAFEKMSNLRLLAFQANKTIKCVNLPSGLDSLPESLRHLFWDGYPLKSLPPTFNSEMLMQLSLRESHVEKLWDGEMKLPNLEILDLSGSKKLIECPNVSASPKLRHVTLSYCEKLHEVDHSIFSLQNLQRLLVNGCTSLKNLCSDTCSPTLTELVAFGCSNLQQFSLPFASVDHLFLGLAEYGANKLPSTILHTENLDTFIFHISDSLVDLPQNFANCIWLVGDPLKDERDTYITLQKILPSPAFLTVKHLILNDIPFLSEIPDNISLLSSLETFELLNMMAIRSLPETIRYLPRLKRLDVFYCNMLQSIPAFSQFIPYFVFRGCESLEKVLSSMREPSDKHNHSFLLPNCTKLDTHSYQTLLQDAFIEIELKANSECEALSFYIFPAMPDMENWLLNSSTQVSFSLELPHNLLGFAYYLVLSPGQVGYGVGLGCECYLDNNSGERINVEKFIIYPFERLSKYNPNPSIDLMSDHMVLWHFGPICKQIMETVEQSKVIHDGSLSYNPKLTFRFFIDETPYDEVKIVECGLHWIYPSEASSSNKNADFEFNNQEDTVPPTNKLDQHVFRTTHSISEIEETKDLRSAFEELLHIGFGV